MLFASASSPFESATNRVKAKLSLNSMKVYAIIVAGGKGRRFGGMKQFFTFKGKPILVHTIEIFERNKNVNSIILVVPPRMIGRTKMLLKTYELKKIEKIVPGGKRRQNSVLNGMKAIEKKDAIVVIHDAVRPFVSQNLINRGIRLCKKYQAVIFGLPVFETVKYARRNRVIKTVSREGLFTIQTPQVFQYQYLYSAYEKVDFKKNFTDESQILESAGLPVYIFKGEVKNIKITTREDLTKAI